VLTVLMTRRWIGLTLGMLALIVAFGALSYWQWQRAQRAEVVPPVAATEVLGLSPLAPSAYATAVELSGTFDAAHQVLVKHGDTVFWVVTPLVPADGIAVPVARATVTSPDDPAVAAVTPGMVSIVGIAQPYEGDPGVAVSLPAGQVDRLTASSLALPYPSVGGWVALTSQTPEAAVGAAVVVPPISGDAPAGLRLQNASYAVQWVLFAAFVVFFWWRLLRDDLRGAGVDRPREAVAPVREVY
jgi:cytochrome oxidase assembly protein ShyY1